MWDIEECDVAGHWTCSFHVFPESSSLPAAASPSVSSASSRGARASQIPRAPCLSMSRVRLLPCRPDEQLTSKEDEILRWVRMVCRAVYSLSSHSGPSNDYHLTQLFLQLRRSSLVMSVVVIQFVVNVTRALRVNGRDSCRECLPQGC